MVTFSFESFGKLKLVISRLEKLASDISMIILPDRCLFFDSNIFLEYSSIEIINGVVPNEGIQFRLNLTNLHNITKNIPAGCKCNLKLVGDNRLHIITSDSKKKTKIRENCCKVEIKKEEVSINQDRNNILKNLDSIYDLNNKICINIANALWSLERLYQSFDSMYLKFKESNLELIGECNEYNGVSIINYESIGGTSLIDMSVCSSNLFKQFWLLELVSSECIFFLDSISLEICASARSDDEKILIFLS